MSSTQAFGLSRRGRQAATGLVSATCGGFQPGTVSAGGSITVEFEACNDSDGFVSFDVQVVFSTGPNQDDLVSRETVLSGSNLGTGDNSPRCTGTLTRQVPAPSGFDGDVNVDVIATNQETITV